MWSFVNGGESSATASRGARRTNRGEGEGGGEGGGEGEDGARGVSAAEAVLAVAASSLLEVAAAYAATTGVTAGGVEAALAFPTGELSRGGLCFPLGGGALWGSLLRSLLGGLLAGWVGRVSSKSVIGSTAN